MPSRLSLLCLLVVSFEKPAKLLQPIWVSPGFSAGRYFQFVSKNPFQGQQRELSGGRIRQCCNHLISKCTLFWPFWHCSVLTGWGKSLVLFFYLHMLGVSPLSVSKGSVICGGLLVFWFSTLKNSQLKSHPNVYTHLGCDSSLGFCCFSHFNTLCIISSYENHYQQFATVDVLNVLFFPLCSSIYFFGQSLFSVTSS